MEDPVALTPIHDPCLDKAGISLHMQREEQIHPVVSGNKWYKLKYNIQRAQEEGHSTLLTFGGAYSNHIYATAAAGHLHGLQTIGIIRGEKTEPLNYTLRQAQAFGMQLHYLDRDAYRKKDDPALSARLQERFGRFYQLPEGGTNLLAVKGCTEMGRYAAAYDYTCACAGTGGTLAGLAVALQGKKQLLGFAALKNGAFLYQEVLQLARQYSGCDFSNFQLADRYHFGGYARFKPELIRFIQEFWQHHQVLLDPVYTGKMMFGLYDMIKQGFFKRGSSVLAIHSGGLQGIYGYNERFPDRPLPLPPTLH